jgi:hypothetical protein
MADNMLCDSEEASPSGPESSNGRANPSSKSGYAALAQAAKTAIREVAP